ncbi:hypothetical protein BVY04_03825 [bacterium M21]|nr:hypothetical protein BVY04_03825 [bacterium M21]
MTEIERAKYHFRGPNRYNCIQAILKAFQHVNNCPDEFIESHRKLGQGRIGEGRCGALYAARMHGADDAQKQKIEEQFVAMAGDAACRPIRKAKQVSCERCVEIAASVLKNELATRVSGEK